jgi:phosphatidylglycerophosphate synthase
MSIKTRHKERLEIISLFAHHMAATSSQKLKLISEWTIAAGILILIALGKVGGWGVAVSGFIVGLDVVRGIEAWRQTRSEIKSEEYQR